MYKRQLSETRQTTNVLADTGAGDAAQTVVVGAHLDSVTEGPGINDNGSGVAGDLEVALQMARLGIQPRRQLRFAFWGAEESGLLGSQHYVDTLGDGLGSIYANLNFDMIGSPNYVRFVYDGDGSATPLSGPPSVPLRVSCRPSWPSLKMITALAPAVWAFAALMAKSQVPRWTSATLPAAKPAKSAASHPLVEPGWAGGGTWTSTAVSAAVASPLPEYSMVTNLSLIHI